MAKGRPTTQAKTAIDALLAAGLARREFKVTTQKLWRKHNGRRFYEYGDAEIFLRLSLERELELTPALLAQGLHVKHYQERTENGRRVFMVLVDTNYERRGKLTVYPPIEDSLERLS
jgi:hypothetical protein